ncbi:MAG: hypothetical protein V3T86_04415 [Planctomycetota bacterium]
MIGGTSTSAGGTNESVGDVIPGVAEFVTTIRSELARCKEYVAHDQDPLQWFGAGGTGYMLVYSPSKRGADRLKGLRNALDDVGDGRFRKLEQLFFLEAAVESAGWRLLQLQLRTLRPKLVVTLGKPATEAVLARRIKLEDEHGVRRPCAGTEVLPLLVPSPNNLNALNRRNLTLESYGHWLTETLAGLIESLPS